MEAKVQTHTLKNGLRIAFLPSDGTATYAGFAIKAGTRDEGDAPVGTAHFVEHMLFKGTEKRKPWHILNRMEAVGGELNAFTEKEDLFVYTIAPKGEIERAMELLADLCFHSTFPEEELNLERLVILDEINSYKDSPSELIFDDFEALLFNGHPLGRSILGSDDSLAKIHSEQCHRFVQEHFNAENMVFVCVGPCRFEKVIKQAEEHFHVFQTISQQQRCAPLPIQRAQRQLEKKALHQCHVLLGGYAPAMHDKKKLASSLLCNLLGGPGMNSRLNIALREKHGLVYQVDASYASLSDTGYWQVYYACEPQNLNKAFKLVQKTLWELREKMLSPTKLRAAKKQMTGQILLAAEQSEQQFLSLCKAYLNQRPFLSVEEINEKIYALSAEELYATAQSMFDLSQLHIVTYFPEDAPDRYLPSSLR